MSMYGAESARPVVSVGTISLTRQSMKAETDINNIVARYRSTGFIEHVATNSPVYADVSDVNDYREALDRVIEVEDFFGKLPAKVREVFANDPATFLDRMVDPAFRPRAVELGLVAGEKPPVVVAEVPAAAAPANAGVQARNADGTFK